MKLQEYYKMVGGEKLDKLAAVVGVTPMHLRHCARGLRIPSRGLSQKIEQATSGKVTAYECLFPNEIINPKRKAK
jgi:DNA-binding transcriptional regulator YdaS (Cro superfamily)